MIDIFEDIKPQPKLYIADVEVRISFKPRKNSSQMETYIVKIDKAPIVLVDNKFPTKKTEESFMKRVFQKHGRRSFEKSNMKLIKISNCRLSSKLAYRFDYDKH